MKQRILFVDDEPKLLEGLGRLLRGRQQEWELEFASGGPQALERLARAPFDVVVSDMRMPEIDGAQLLAKVRDQFPHIVRIVLSGQCDKKAFLRLAAVAHRHLAKPCDAEVLKETLKRAWALRELVANEKLRALVSRLESVPSVPAVYAAVGQELDKVGPSITKMASYMRGDMGMTAKIMQLASSAFFDASKPIADPKQAAVTLGCDVLGALMRAAQAFSEFKCVNDDRSLIDMVWRHSLAVSALARRIAVEENCDARVVDSASVAGMLHDIGKLIFAQHLPAGCDEVSELTLNEGIALCDAERQVFGVSHAEVGAYLLGLWGLDPAIVQAVAWHHRPSMHSTPAFTPLTAIHVADVLSQHSTPLSPRYREEGIDEPYLAMTGVAHRLPRWQDLTEEIDIENVYLEVIPS